MSITSDNLTNSTPSTPSCGGNFCKIGHSRPRTDAPGENSAPRPENEGSEDPSQVLLDLLRRVGAALTGEDRNKFSRIALLELENQRLKRQLEVIEQEATLLDGTTIFTDDPGWSRTYSAVRRLRLERDCLLSQVHLLAKGAQNA